MLQKLSAYFRSSRQLVVIAAMIFSSGLCVSLLTIRFVHTHSYTYAYLIWNLFLAWMPMISAFVAYNLHQKSVRSSWVWVCVCAGVWLVFLPNAPYLITDIVHLRPRDNFAFWFDLIMFVTFAWTGLFFGLISLYIMQGLVSRIAGPAVSWVFVLVVSALSSFGIYLGRFPRWNSWDVVTQPTDLLTDIGERIRHPFANLETFAFSGLFTLFLLSVYFMLIAVTNLRSEGHRE
jgi:uncharacterized membrane protein